MVIIHGVYHWSPKQVEFRNDYCLSCSAQRRAIRVRTFDVAHLFWIPILPLGFWKRWKRCPRFATHSVANLGDPQELSFRNEVRNLLPGQIEIRNITRTWQGHGFRRVARP